MIPAPVASVAHHAPRHRSRGLASQLAASALALWLMSAVSGCYGGSDTLVAMTLSRVMPLQPTGTHYELFATLNHSAVSLVRFELRVVTTEQEPLEVVDHFSPNTVYGVTDGFDQFLRPVGGIRLRVPINLSLAGELFITREQNGDTDPAPSRDLVAFCVLKPGGRGTTRCELVTADEKAVAGSAALILPGDGPHGL